MMVAGTRSRGQELPVDPDLCVCVCVGGGSVCVCVCGGGVCVCGRVRILLKKGCSVVSLGITEVHHTSYYRYRTYYT